MKKTMMEIPLEHGLILAIALFLLGFTGLLIRRNIIFMLLSIEIMLNAAGLAFVIGGARWSVAEGQIMFLFILTMTAAEVSVGLALILKIFQKYRTLDTDEMNRMRY